MPRDIVIEIPKRDTAPDWPELIPLDHPDLPRLDLDHLPGWAGAYAKALGRSTETPPELAAALVLAVCATATARRLRLMVSPGYFEPLNLWPCVALEPGNRKSAVQGAACAPLLDWERDQAAAMTGEIQAADSERKTMEARARELRSKAAKAEADDDARNYASQAAQIEAELPEVPRPPQLWTSDATPEKLGALMADHGECMAWLSSEGGVFDLLAGRYSSGIPNLDLVLKSWSGDPERVDRGSRPPVYLHQPALTIGLSPQPDVLKGLASKPGFLGRGLLGRFLFLMPPSPLGHRTLTPAGIPQGAVDAYAAGVRAMLEWTPEIDPETGMERRRLIRLSEAAHAEWLAFARHIEASMLPGGEFEHAKDWAGKCPGQAARLAGILHGIEYAHGEPWAVPVAVETMGQALEVMAVIARHTLAVYALMGADPGIDAARKVWDWIRRGRREAFKARDAFNALRATFPKMHPLMDALAVLEERGYLEVIEPQADGPGRRPSPTVRVRPDIAEGWR
ncbi:YfjI family protein [Ectothiorhodospira shaposhnikovii]|uniref:YfjI family protein n=1 Tax=Ectothiorhodospira shaposhnikovii TaxID=1054 RepID=UPI0039A175FA